MLPVTLKAQDLNARHLGMEVLIGNDYRGHLIQARHYTRGAKMDSKWVELTIRTWAGDSKHRLRPREEVQVVTPLHTKEKK